MQYDRLCNNIKASEWHPVNAKVKELINDKIILHMEHGQERNKGSHDFINFWLN